MWGKLKRTKEEKDQFTPFVPSAKLTDSEKFVISIGNVAKSKVPEIFTIDLDKDAIPIRKLAKLAGHIGADIAMGEDSTGVGKIDFKLMISEYKRLTAKK